MLELTAIQLINVLFIAAGTGICGLCFLEISSSMHLGKEVRRYFQIFFIMILIYILAHLVRELLGGTPGSDVRAALCTVTFLEVLAAGFMSHMISVLILYVADTGRPAKIIMFSFTVLLVIHGILLAAGGYYGFMFYYDAANMYHRGSAYLLSNLCPLAMLVIDMVLLIRYEDKFEQSVRSAFWFYIIAPVVAIVIQTFFYGIQLIIFAIVIAAVYMFSVIVRIQNSRYQKQQLESSRLETELSTASGIQAAMLPSIFPAFPNRREFDLYASMTPAKEVGGDFYNFFLVDDDHLCLIIADVSGKGIPAALFMMASMIILANNAMLGKSPAGVLTAANESICANNKEGMFVTVWIGILEISTGRLTAANAGHEYPTIMRPGGDFEILKDKHGFVVGGMAGKKYTDYELMLEPGTKLFVYTDGVVEATDARGKRFETWRMLEALNRCRDATPEEVLRGVSGAVNGFVLEAEQFDDITMLCMEYRGCS